MAPTSTHIIAPLNNRKKMHSHTERANIASQNKKERANIATGNRERLGSGNIVGSQTISSVGSSLAR
jgi:hypothetical protein